MVAVRASAAGSDVLQREQERGCRRNPAPEMFMRKDEIMVIQRNWQSLIKPEKARVRARLRPVADRFGSLPSRWSVASA